MARAKILTNHHKIFGIFNLRAFLLSCISLYIVTSFGSCLFHPIGIRAWGTRYYYYKVMRNKLFLIFEFSTFNSHCSPLLGVFWDPVYQYLWFCKCISAAPGRTMPLLIYSLAYSFSTFIIPLLGNSLSTSPRQNEHISCPSGWGYGSLSSPSPRHIKEAIKMPPSCDTWIQG